MTVDFKLIQKVKGDPSAEVAPQRRLKVIPDQDYMYDMPKELITSVLERFSINQLLNCEDKSEAVLRQKGQDFMRILIEKADSDLYRDRTAEMIVLVAQQTGEFFPHVFERYLELGILTLRPKDVWAVTEATTRCLKLRSFNCSLELRFKEKGIENCQDFCLASCRAAAEKTGLELEMDCRRSAENQGICELVFLANQRL